MTPGVTSRRWSGATPPALAALLATATLVTSTGPVASTAVSHPVHEEESALTVSDYDFVGNNIAAGQFQAQVWGPVCGDPSAGEATKRAEISYDWTRK
jgi:hypothetical protein